MPRSRVIQEDKDGSGKDLSQEEIDEYIRKIDAFEGTVAGRKFRNYMNRSDG